MRRLVLRKIYKFILFITISASILFLTMWPDVKAQSATNDQLADIQAKLDALVKQRNELNEQIKKEQATQNTLAQQAKNLERQIKQNEVQIEILELELKKINLEVKILKEEQEKIQSRLHEIQDKLEQLESELKSSINLLYKLSMNRPNLLYKDMSFQDTIVNEERERSTLRIIKANINEIKALQAQVVNKKNEIDAKEKEVSELQAQLEAQTNNLNLQQEALKWQKNNKEALLNQSKQSQANLSARVREASAEIMKLEAKRAEIINAIANMPVSGTYVSAGQVIGFQGRSGLSCDLYDPILEPIRTNDYCERWGFTTSDWYYYDPVRFPAKGSHLHFEYRVLRNGRYVPVNPYDMLFNSRNKEFKSLPLNPMYFSRGFGGGHTGIDIYSYHGAPVYAVKPGYVSYFCENYPPDQNFPDPLFVAKVFHVDENGNLDGTLSLYLHLQRRGLPCTYVS